MGEIRKQQWGDLVGALENILHDRVGLTEGCRDVVDIGHGLGLTTPLFDPFRGFESETDAFPVGKVRQLWAEEALQNMDRQRAKAEAHYRDWVLEAARNLLAYAKEQRV